MGRSTIFSCALAAVCLLFLLPVPGITASDTITVAHQSFYRAGSVLHINRVLKLPAQKDRGIQSVTIDYHMAISRLGIEWLADGKVISSESLPRGLNQSVTFVNRQNPLAELSVRFTGERGQLQVLSVSATMEPEGSEKTPGRHTPQKSQRTRLQQPASSPFFEIVAPGPKTSWEKGGEAVVYWNSRGIGGRLALELFKDRDRIRVISRTIPVSAGSYRWKLSGREIVPGTGYQVRLTTLADRQSRTSEKFSITEPYSAATLQQYTPVRRTLTLKDAAPDEPVSLQVTSPRYREQWDLFEEIPIRWKSTGLTREDEIIIVLHRISTRGNMIIGKVKNTGEYMYPVPYPRIFFGHDLRILLRPLRDVDIEARSDPFAILKPGVDLICSSPSITYRLPQRRPRKWWEVAGDIFTGGITWSINEAVEVTNLLKTGTIMTVTLTVFQRGREILGDVVVGCDILAGDRLVEYAFAPQTIDFVRPDIPYLLVFEAPTRPMGLKAGTYQLAITLDPDRRQQEPAPLRANNRVSVEFTVK